MTLKQIQATARWLAVEYSQFIADNADGIDETNTTGGVHYPDKASVAVDLAAYLQAQYERPESALPNRYSPDYRAGHADGYDKAHAERDTVSNAPRQQAKPVPDLPTLHAEAAKRRMRIVPDARAGCFNVYWPDGDRAFCVSLREVAEHVIGG